MFNLRDGREQRFDIRISNLACEVCTLTVGPGWSVKDVKLEIEKVLLVPHDLLTLVHGSKELEDSQHVDVLYSGDALDLILVQQQDHFEEWADRVERTPLSLEEAPYHVRNDPRIVARAVKGNGRAFNFATQELKQNRSFVLSLVRMNGCVLQAASDELKGDQEIVLAAASQNEHALKYGWKELRRDRNFILSLVRRNPEVLTLACVGASLKTDPEVLSVSRVGMIRCP